MPKQKIKRPTGRPPTVPTEEQAAAIATARGSGMGWKHSAWAAGISPMTLLRWRDRGELGESPYDAFVDRVERARGEWVRGRLSQIQAAASEDWRAAGWLLERAEVQEYGRRVMEHQGQDGGPVDVTVHCTLG
jgi:hypothetical protein